MLTLNSFIEPAFASPVPVAVVEKISGINTPMSRIVDSPNCRRIVSLDASYLSMRRLLDYLKIDLENQFSNHSSSWTAVFTGVRVGFTGVNLATFGAVVGLSTLVLDWTGCNVAVSTDLG